MLPGGNERMLHTHEFQSPGADGAGHQGLVDPLVGDDAAVLGLPKVEIVHFTGEENTVFLIFFRGIVKIKAKAFAGEDPLIIFL